METTLAPQAVLAAPPISYTIKSGALAVGLSESYLRAAIRRGYLIARYAGDKPLPEI